MFDLLCNFIFIIGFVRLTIFVVDMIKSVWLSFQKHINFKTRYGEGSWVLVTGGAGGIGQAYWKFFANHGFNLIIIDFNQEALDKAKEMYPNVEVRTICKDLSQIKNADGYWDLIKDVIDLDISILINNVVYTSLHPFDEESLEVISRSVKVSICTMTALTSILLPKLKSRMKKSAIINMASVVARVPILQVPLYSCAKGYNRYFSRALTEELRGQIDVLTCCPGPIKTELTKGSTDPSMITPDECVNNLLKGLTRKDEVSSSLMHGFVYGLAEVLYHCSLKLYVKADDILSGKPLKEARDAVGLKSKTL